jgi:acetyltransferase-like isoleucine patch superfamily enzyme
MDPDLEELLTRAKEVYLSLDARMRERWDRSLPVEELLFDRWERARSLGFGEGTSIYHSSYVYGEVKVGRNTWIGPYTMLDGTGGGLEIGDSCCISAGAQIYTHDTVRRTLSGMTRDPERSPVRIGDCSYIGAASVITRGVTLGDHVVIGAGAVVKSDIPPYSVAVGVPARVRGRVVIDGGEIRMEYEL